MRETLIETLPTWLPAQALVPQADAIWLLTLLVVFGGALLLVARAGLDTRVAFWAGLCGIAGALVLGRLWIVLFDEHAGGWASALDLLEGEKSVIGEALGAGLASALWLRLARQPVLPYLDAAIPAGLAGYALGRMGCLLAGCCFGTPTDLPWGIHYPPGSNPYLAQLATGLIPPSAAHSHAVHPIPVYHTLLGIALCWATFKAPRAPGRALAIGLAGYGLGRFLLEFIRGDALPTDLWLSIAQLGSIVFIVGGVMLWVASARRASAAPYAPLQPGAG
jgi:phosphatidylglycerol:prolipoprotein diacylglycerol transferase